MPNPSSSLLALAFVATLSQEPAVSAELRRAYLDTQQQVHIVSEDGRDHRMSGMRAKKLTIAADGSAVAWLSVAGPDATFSEELRVYRSGLVGQIICGPLIDEFRFRRGGQQIVIRCAGLHFAGWQNLYDVRTLNLIDSFDEAHVALNRRPEWSLDND